MSRVARGLIAGLLFFPALSFLPGCSCGFDCNNDRNQGSTSLTLGFSDSLPEDLKQVVIEVDSITFRRTGADDVVVDEFTIPELGLVAADTFQADLLDYRGRNQLKVLTGLELNSGSYSQVLIRVLGGDINRSYVLDADDAVRQLSVTGSVLTLPGPRFDTADQAYTVEFDLSRSLQSVDAGSSYLLTAEGVRLENDATAAGLSGRVDSALFDSVAPCSEKDDPTRGNRVYLYQGSPQSGKRLGDVYTTDSSTTVPADVLPPFAVASLLRNSLTANWEYVFGFLPAGDYTLAFACNTEADDSVNYDSLVVPLPEAQVYGVKLTTGSQLVCDLVPGGSC